MRAPSSNSINLASAPFQRERAQNAAYAAACGVLICSLLVLVSLVLHERAQAGDLRKTIDGEHAQLSRLQRQQVQFASVLAKPHNADVFSESVFLNELIARRAVSWTRVFKDLTTVMPGNMRLIAIRLPQLGAEEKNGTNKVQLDMVLGTDKPATVIEFLKRLQTSNMFGAATVVNQQSPTQNNPLYQYRVTVAYDQAL